MRCSLVNCDLCNIRWFNPHSRQSAKPFLQSSELGLPQPLTPGESVPPPVLVGGARSLAREGLGESLFRRGDTRCGTLYIYVLVLCVYTPQFSGARIFKRLWSPGIDSKASIPPAYVAWRAGMITLFLLSA